MPRWPWTGHSVWACSCCARASVRQVRSSGQRQALVCPDCDETPAAPQAPWDGVLERWSAEQGDGST